MTTNALFNGPPLGFLRTLVVEKKGIHKNQLSLKMSGLVPIVDAMRILALSASINQTNTIRRLNEVRDRGLLPGDMAEDIKESFNFIMLLRVKHHLTLKVEGKEPTDFVDPRFLSKIQRKSLIEAFHVERDLQGELESRFPESL
jgi:CBS domain-containing protein